MKKRFLNVISGILVFLIIGVLNIPVKAAGKPVVSIEMKGNFEVGQEVEFDINLSNIDSFFAGSVDIKLDPAIVKILEIDKGSFIDTNTFNITEPYKSVSDTEGRARYGFSCLGQVNGFSGSGTFAKIKAKVLKKDNILIKNIEMSKEFTKDNNIILQIIDGTPKEIGYSFNQFEFKVAQGQPSTTVTPGNNSGTNTGSTNNTNSNNSNTGANNAGSISNGSKTDENSKPGVEQNKQVLKKDDKGNQTTNKSQSILFFSGAVFLLAAASGSYFFYTKRKKVLNK